MIDFTKVGRVGDKVRSIEGGEGVILLIVPETIYPIAVGHDNGIRLYTKEGMADSSNRPSLSFDNGSIRIDQGTPPSRETEELHCGLTEAQWQWVIDGEFLVCFSDKSIEEAKSNAWIAVLNRRMKSKGVAYPFSGENTVWRYAAIPDMKGIRKPHFGGACPTTHEGAICYKLRNGDWVNMLIAKDVDMWSWREDSSYDVIEYIELP